MSRHHRKKKSNAASVQRSAQQRSNDRGIYAVIIMVGLFGLGLWYLVSYETFPHAVIGYLAAVLGIVNWCAFKAFSGMDMADWQESLARLPLHFAGYGTRQGRPVKAAQGQANAKMVLMISVALSVAILVGVTLLLIR